VNTALHGTVFGGHVHHFDLIDSTNTRALAEAQAGAAAGQVYIADEQTAGRGRGGHAWHSEPDRGLYLTMLVRPNLRSSDVLKLSLMTGLAAVDAISKVTSCIVDLRWPNDLVMGSQPARKLGGILTEAVSTPAGHVRYAAIGIGINLNQVEFTGELAATATSLRRESGAYVNREDLAIAFLRAMNAELECVSDRVDDDIFHRFERASTWVQGKRVQVAEHEGYTGTTAGLTADGLLRIACDDGTERVVRHGGVREL
jgi:BirA family biotin operon repressor/biotin-[acetyl-CoA-carboxylase] ligase